MDDSGAAAVAGTWELVMRTPVGSIPATMTFTRDGGQLTGTAEGRQEVVALEDVRADDLGDTRTRVLWRQRITKPLRLTLEFEVVVEGDDLTGHSRAGRLPRSEVTGRRTTASPEDGEIA